MFFCTLPGVKQVQSSPQIAKRIMINAVYINCYSCVKCAIVSVCMTCRRSVTDGEIRSSSHIYTSLSHRLSSERKSVLLVQISPPSVFFHPNTLTHGWLVEGFAECELGLSHLVCLFIYAHAWCWPWLWPDLLPCARTDLTCQDLPVELNRSPYISQHWCRKRTMKRGKGR